jgi:hypothetical protein
MRVKPMGALLMMLAGWINRHQQDLIVGIRVSLVQDCRAHSDSSGRGYTPLGQQGGEGLPQVVGLDFLDELPPVTA